MRLGCLASESLFDGAGGVWAAASGVCSFDVDSWLCVGGTTARSGDCGCCVWAKASPGPPIRAVQTSSDRAKHVKAFEAWAIDMIFKDLPSSDAFTTSSVPLEDLLKLKTQRNLNLGGTGSGKWLSKCGNRRQTRTKNRVDQGDVSDY